MKLLRSSLILLLVLGMAVGMAACSGGNAPTNPDNASLNLPDSFGTPTDEGRNVIAAYQATIDPVAETFTIEPVDRFGAYHYPLSDHYKVLSIVSYNFGPPFTANIKLTHPYPGSGIKGYDARVIAVLPANTGVNMGYPTLQVLANNKVLTAPDGYTKLFDKGLTGNTNPFVAYFKDKPFREWSSTVPNHTETKQWVMDINGFGGPLTFYLVVDVCTNFPAAPTPVTDNCPEPAEITSTTVGTIKDVAGSNGPVEVTILDWQSATGTTVKVEAPSLADGAITLAYAGPGGANLYIFDGTLTNTKAAPEGTYGLLVEAKDNATGTAMYDAFTFTVTHQGGGGGAWILDPARANIDTSLWTQPATLGTDIGVVDGSVPDWNGVVMYDDFSQVILSGLDLADGNIYGYAYLPSNNKGTHPAPDTQMAAGRIDASAENGFVYRSFVDSNVTLGPAGNGLYQREDCLVMMTYPLAGFLDWYFGVFIGPNDNTTTPDYNEKNEQLRASDVCDEANKGTLQNNVMTALSGTVLKDIGTSTYNVVGAEVGFKDPYYNGSTFINDWPATGVWVITNPPFSEIVAMDASQDPVFPMQDWAYGGDIFVNEIAWYTKDTLAFTDGYVSTDATAKFLDMQLIPLQNPPLVVNTFTQYNDWVAVLLDNGTVEVFDPFMVGGQLIETVDISELVGTVDHMDIANNSADIFITHNDGAVEYVSVYTLQ